MRERRIDLWSVKADALCITTNGTINSRGAAVMGRGCALEAKRMFRGLDKSFGLQIERDGNVVQEILRTLDFGVLVAFPVKYEYYEPADLGLIRKSAEQLIRLADERKWTAIALPRPGCGNGSRSWEYEVKPLLEPLLDDRFLVVTQP